ncbi:MAG: alkaline phosphatase family protein [Candidatus Latescibacteria bacterium]|jgi:arylsulfatase A-like enzyme|nr:alkaline phosphatase family protein [Candidatus Latescibacterota bacterium]
MSTQVILVVLDGLRPDLVNEKLTPHIHELGQCGVTFSKHHAVFPSVTRVNSASIATGCLPGRHGLVDNVMYVPSLFPDELIDTGDHEQLRMLGALSGGKVLTAPTLTEKISEAGLTSDVVTSSSSGACFLQDRAGTGTTLNPAYCEPAQIHFPDSLNSIPAKARPSEALNLWVIDAMLTLLRDDAPDLGIVWLCDPDHTQHGFGPGAPESLEAIRIADNCVGALVEGVRALGDETNVIVMSDHGWISYEAPLNVAASLFDSEPVRQAPKNSLTVAGQGLYLTDDIAPEDVLPCLMAVDGMGPVFTRQGTAGTFPFEAIGYEHSRSPDVLFAPAWNTAPNGFGIEGMSRGSGPGGHGGSSPYEMNAMMVGSGPDFLSGLMSDIPTGHVDLHPTILHLLGIRAESQTDGRILFEALRGGDACSDLEVMSDSTLVTSETREYRLYRSFVDDVCYTDQANLQRD